MTSFSCYVVGQGSLTIQCAEHLVSSGHVLQGVVSREDAVVSWARRNGIAVVEPGKDLHERLQTPFDVLFSIANFDILSEAVLSLPVSCAINFHDGPLPEYAGLNVTSWAIINGESKHAVSWHLMERGVDTGDVLIREPVDIDPEETSFSLNAKCYQVGLETFETLVRQLEQGEIARTPTDPSHRTYFSAAKRPAQGAIIDWRQPADEIIALVRGLDFGPYPNPLGQPKCLIGSNLFVVEEAVPQDLARESAPGFVESVDGLQIVVATASGGVRLRIRSDIDGRPVERLDVTAGDQLSEVPPKDVQSLDARAKAFARHEPYWIDRLSKREPLQLPFDSGAQTAGGPCGRSEQSLNDMSQLLAQLGIDRRSDALPALIALVFAKLVRDEFTLGVRFVGDNPLDFFSDVVPWNMRVNAEQSALAHARSAADSFRMVTQSGSYARDASTRFPAVSDSHEFSYRVVVEINNDSVPSSLQDGEALRIVISEESGRAIWCYDRAAFSDSDISALQSQVQVLSEKLVTDEDKPLSDLSLIKEDELAQLLFGWNDTERPVPDACVHELIEATVNRTPNAMALVHRDRTLTYRQMNDLADRLAARLIEQGVETESLVGIFVDRSIEMVISCLAVMKAGGAYVPLDPEFPRDRLSFMIEDAGIEHVITVPELVDDMPAEVANVVMASEGGDVSSASESRSRANPDNLCYVIYTSGSTGRPKGVQLEHRNVVNFFVGMDERVAHDEPGVWLAVTSLSFDISVLELFWTLARGFQVVIFDGVEATVDGSPSSKPMDFSLFFFASGEGGDESADKYRLLLDASRFGDEHGFAAVWTPERHFHAFGGLYPNPSVASAAIAAITENLQIRAGSCVSPLHSPIRIAEEWAVVDNLSRGRVGISFAAGWQPDDFVLMPENFAERKAIMFRQIEEVQELWRGGSVRYTNGKGKEIEVRTLPRPVQESLPVWITAAGSPDTFRMAGEHGYNVLTHLLGQSKEELAEKIQVYRTARLENGFDPDDGNVTLMLHTFVGEDHAEVKELVRQPMKDYLKSSIGLIKLAAWSFPTFRQKTTSENGEFSVGHLSEEEFDEVLDFSFERYFETSGLFGTVDDCLKIVDECKNIGVTEVACLIDYGVDADLMMDQLPRLNDLRMKANEHAVAQAPRTFPQLVKDHGVTHFQCTPSMASMLTTDREGLDAIGAIKHVMIGGEAFPASLARRLTEVLPSGITNMYGPTETTIWSSTAPVRPNEDLTIGRPIANTAMYVVDANGVPVPTGVPGELWIGGKGVARGYLKRPELTAERFLEDPFLKNGDRVYRTGDLVRYRSDGTIDFLGRMDYQVKVRGYRIELGEIESVLASHPDVAEAVAVVREDSPDDRRIVAYVIGVGTIKPAASELRQHLAERLPDYMVPTNFVVLDRFPITPNGKVDRKRLPAPLEVTDVDREDIVVPRNPLEKELAQIWEHILQVSNLGVTDNFFDLGGNSLIAVNLVSRVRSKLGVELPLMALFRSPTVADMSTVVAELQISQASEDELEEAMSNLSVLSDEEVKALLAREG